MVVAMLGILFFRGTPFHFDRSGFGKLSGGIVRLQPSLLFATQQVVKRSGLSPDFESERLAFDIVEPQEFVVGGDVSLSIEIWDDSAWSDDLLASVHLSALR